MKILIASIVSLAVLILAGGIFYHWLKPPLHAIIRERNDSITPEIEGENWEKALSDIEKQLALWKRYKKKAIFFLDAENINDIDRTFARTDFYIRSRDVSNGMGGDLCPCLPAEFSHGKRKDKFAEYIIKGRPARPSFLKVQIRLIFIIQANMPNDR